MIERYFECGITLILTLIQKNLVIKDFQCHQQHYFYMFYAFKDLHTIVKFLLIVITVKFFYCSKRDEENQFPSQQYIHK